MMNEKIMYRVTIKISYYEAWFEFEDLNEAGEFAKTILAHQIENEDTKKKTQVNISVIAYGMMEGEEEVNE